MDLIMMPQGINRLFPRNAVVYSPDPRARAYCLQLNVKIYLFCHDRSQLSFKIKVNKQSAVKKDWNHFENK